MQPNIVLNILPKSHVYSIPDAILIDTLLKGTVAREKLLNWGLGKRVWTLIIDCTWVLHFSDQLFNCHNILTVCRLNVKPVWLLSETVAFR